MKILIVNKFFYPRGGDCVVAMATKQLLEEHGHEVRVFAMSYPANLPIADCQGYASEVSFSHSGRSKLRAAYRLLGRGDIVEASERVLDDFQPDVVHLHNVHSYLSPVIGEIAHRRGIRVVWTLHDFKLICPVYTCRRPSGENCEECLNGTIKVAAHRCMKGSLAQSLLADIEARTWNRRRLQSFTDLFIAPSRFLHNKMLQGGFEPSRLTTLCNFVDPAKYAIMQQLDPSLPREDYFCYVGRLCEEKGTHTLLEAASEAGVRLKVAGGGPLLSEMKRKYADNKKIEFYGHVQPHETVSLLYRAKASVIPSEWNENNPLSVIESLCIGTPVIGADIGGIPELIDETSGITFTSGNAEELARVFADFDKRRPFRHKEIATRASQLYNSETHYRQLMEAYSPRP